MSNKTGNSKEQYYARYKQNNTYKTNKLKKLARELKRNPNNTTVSTAMSNVVNYARATPKTRPFRGEVKRLATFMKLWKLYSGVLPKNTYNTKLSVAARFV